MYQSSLLANPEVQTNEKFALQNGKMLKATLGQASGMTEFYARKGSMIAYQGQANFDTQYQGWGEQFARRMTGEGMDIMRVTGNGTVFLANQAQDVHILDLTGDGLTIAGQNVLAFEKGLRWNIVRIDSQVQISGVGNYQIEMSGRGKVAILTSGPPVVMHVHPQNYFYADSDAVVAWSSSLDVQMQAAVTSSSVWRPRQSTGESWQMAFVGQGYAVVQPCELMPPYNALSSNAGLAERFGLGQHGQGGFGMFGGQQ